MEPEKPFEIHFLKRKPDTSLKKQYLNVDSNLIDSPKKAAEPDDNLTKLRKQMEFYLGDANLHNDKFLLNLLRQNEKGFIDLTIFLNFNKVKKLLLDNPSLESKLSALKKAILSSNLLKLNKAQTKVRRRINYIVSKSDDKKVIYVENLPENITHETLAKIFSKCDEILHVSVPKYSETHAPKGFAFIEFKTESGADAAVEKYNNCIPEECLGDSNVKGKLLPFNVMPKTKWLEMKKEFKDLKQKLFNLMGKEEESFQQQESFIEKELEKKEGCLVKIRNIDKSTAKQDILVAIKHFCNPAYIDYKNNSENCIVRFENSTLRNAFLEKCIISPLKIGKKMVEVEKIEGAEEDNYWEEILKKKNAFHHYLFNKKQNAQLKKTKKN